MVKNIILEIEKIIKGKREKIEIILATFFAGGHILLEDIPGVGKTTISKTISKVLGLEFSRIQFTADLLPSDILGVNYFDLAKKEFIFKEGAIFTDILLADEINRASSKTQSALLEAMEESQVSIDGSSFILSETFFVIATKNPIEDAGTFELPTSQIDRFMSSLSIGYPNREAEKLILLRKGIPELNSFYEDVILLRKKAKDIFVSDEVVEFILKILDISRAKFKYGLSTRAGISLIDLAKSWAMIKDRDFVIDEDVVNVLPYITNHRFGKNSDKEILQELL